ncbi:MAG: hypothetical protein VB092_05630 [Oscillospiraceae bacterium]|nr:hypothetical protein [Oscillospiraceae bacterium]
MKKVLAGCLAAVLLACMSACDAPAADALTVKIQCACDGEEIHQIYYSCYLGGEYYSMGGMADLDGNALTSDTPLERVFDKSYFDGSDPTALSMDFSPYGKDDTSERGTTNKVELNAAYGQSCTILLSGNKEDGYTARLLDED